MGYSYGRGFGLKIASANSKEGDGVGVGPVTLGCSKRVKDTRNKLIY